jgi:pyridoxal phosphate enzyme (YggS family)
MPKLKRMGIDSNLRSILGSIPPHVKLVAVSKMRSQSEMMDAYRAGQRAFGENKAQEMAAKQPLMPTDTKWHFIGHLQTNKVRLIAPFVSVIHSIDSLKLLSEVNREALRNNRVIDCLLQFHIATEETKFGLDLPEAMDLLRSDSFRSLTNIKVAGVMGMATFSEDEGLVRREFRTLRGHFGELRRVVFHDQPEFREISMGMSGDYQIAVEEGSTMIRVGTFVFGER